MVIEYFISWYLESLTSLTASSLSFIFSYIFFDYIWEKFISAARAIDLLEAFKLKDMGNLICSKDPSELMTEELLQIGLRKWNIKIAYSITTS